MATAHPLPVYNHSFFDTPQAADDLVIDSLYDIAILGGGISGVSVALEASRTTLRTILFERGLETSAATTRANSGIVHCGVHTARGTLKGELEQKGRKIFPHLCRNLNVSLRRCGELVVARNEAELSALQELQKACESLGLESSLWGSARVRLEEPNLDSDAIEGALSIPGTSVVNPFELCNAITNCALVNGVEISCGSTVVGIRKIYRSAVVEADTPGKYIPKVLFEVKVSRQGALPVYTYAKIVVNATGVDADLVTGFLKEAAPVSITKRRGELYVLDKNLKDVVTRVIFSINPKDSLSKGILITPTVDGTVMVGPTADLIEKSTVDTLPFETTDDGRVSIFTHVHALCPVITTNDIMYSFASSRAIYPGNDFLIKDDNGFIQCTGIQSPGLTAAPAIGAYLIELIKLRYPSHQLTKLDKAPDSWIWYPITSRLCRTPLDKRFKLIERDINFTKVVCECESVTEADIENAITEGARSLIGLKLRTRATAGRCQGSFCARKLRKLLEERLGVTYEQICKINHTFPMDRAYPASAVSIKLYRSMDSSEASIRANMKLNLLCGQKQSIQSILDMFSFNSRFVNCIHAFDLVVLGAGPAGLGAALSAYKANPNASILIITKDSSLGGSLMHTFQRNCGVERYKDFLTGPEFSSRLQNEVLETGVVVLRNTFISDSSYSASRKMFSVACLSENVGQLDISAKAVISCLGCREIHRFNAAISGTRPYGVMTADFAQRMLAFDGLIPGKRTVILGSESSGLAVARQIMIAGGAVVGIFEPESHLVGCSKYLDLLTKEFHVPIYYNKSVARIHGNGVLSSVTVADVNSLTKELNTASSQTIECDCLILSMGYVPQTVLVKNMGCKGISRQYNGPLIDSRFAVANDKPLYVAGSNLHAHPSADSLCREGEIAGFNAMMDVSDTTFLYNVPSVNLVVHSSNYSDIDHVLPQSIVISKHANSEYNKTLIYFKTTRAMRDVQAVIATASTNQELAVQKFDRVDPNMLMTMTITNSVFRDLVPGTEVILRLKFEPCEFVVDQDQNDLIGVFSTIVPVKSGEKPCLMVKNKEPIPLKLMDIVMKELRQGDFTSITAPVLAGHTVLRNIGDRVDFVACESVKAISE